MTPPLHKVTRGAQPRSTLGQTLLRDTFIEKLVAAGTTARLSLGGEHFIVTYSPHVIERTYPAGTPVAVNMHGNGTLMIYGREATGSILELAERPRLPG